MHALIYNGARDQQLSPWQIILVTSNLILTWILGGGVNSMAIGLQSHHNQYPTISNQSEFVQDIVR